MKRIARDPLKFDVFNALAIYGRQEKVSLVKPETTESFVAKLRSSIESALRNPQFLYGQRTQAMFASLVVSLGHCRLLKEEDAGEIYAADEKLEVPDFRLIQDNGNQVLIEVKNFYQGNDDARFELSESYLTGLCNYARLMGASVKLAVYWVKWGMWMLNSPNHYKMHGGKATISIGEAMMANEMHLLGDRMIGTKFPLSLRIVADPDKPRTVGPDGEAVFSIRDFELFCETTQITNNVEKNVAWHLMLYGKWREEKPEMVLTANQVDAVVFRWMPLEDSGQGFERVGFLSEMFSNFYNHMTIEEGRPKSIHADINPGHWGQLIPDGYKGEALPLWIIKLKPNKKLEDKEIIV
jgi:hypothetical protein